MFESHAADLIRAGGWGTVFILLAMPEAERDLGFSIAAREVMIAAHHDANAGENASRRPFGRKLAHTRSGSATRLSVSPLRPGCPPLALPDRPRRLPARRGFFLSLSLLIRLGGFPVHGQARPPEDELRRKGDPLRGPIGLSAEPLEKQLSRSPSDFLDRPVDQRNGSWIEQRDIGSVAGDQAEIARDRRAVLLDRAQNADQNPVAGGDDRRRPLPHLQKGACLAKPEID